MQSSVSSLAWLALYQLKQKVSHGPSLGQKEFYTSGNDIEITLK